MIAQADHVDVRELSMAAEQLQDTAVTEGGSSAGWGAALPFREYTLVRPVDSPAAQRLYQLITGPPFSREVRGACAVGTGM